MKQTLVILSTLLVSTFAFAADTVEQPAEQQQYQPVCHNEAVQAAQVLFSLNNKTTVGLELKDVQIIDAANAPEGGYEVYDVVIALNGVTHSPYRITTSLKGCTILSFEMPFEN
ncbi:hypothetical protein CIK05_09490 [Bdellovibrio sp. qaytius]|nr:hypothetical protein CIK05_09490 [Bdellovibrio sp. qaytius]